MGPHAGDSQSVQHIVVMGVSGSGKTTLGERLRDRLGWAFAEADEFHPRANIDKMESGTALTDEDRWPWLVAMRNWLDERARVGANAIVTCSALKRSYRDLLREAAGRMRFVHVTAPPEVLAQRITLRKGHFMPPELLPSQLATLEPLDDDEDGVTITVDVPPDEVLARTLAALGLAAGR